jgi:ATP-dependent Lon protease
VIPAENEKDLAEIPENVKQNLTIKTVKWIDEVLEIALQFMPSPLVINESKETAAAKAEASSVTIVAH